MSEKLNIQYLPHQYIDKQKWDKCIDTASNGLIYGYSFYLDHMAKHWDALVLNDYEAVMPLTWNRKYGIYYLYQPFLTAQLGVFGKNINEELVRAFLEAVPSKFKYWDIYLNYKNVFPVKEYEIYDRSNFVLDLKKPYYELKDNYSDNIRRNVHKATQAGCIPCELATIEDVINLALQQMKQYHKESKDNVKRFRKLYEFLHARKMAAIYSVCSKNSFDILASCVFFFSHGRAYYILVGNHPKGKTMGASHALIDSFIAKNAEKRMLLDFEGSDIPSLALFYSSFGAIEEKFAGLKLNRLPSYLRFFKK